MFRRLALTTLAAVLGIAVTAALAWSAGQLAGQRIGLAAEPVSVERGLAPHHRINPVTLPSTDGGRDRESHPSRTSRSSTASPSTTVLTTTATIAPATTAAPPSATGAAPTVTQSGSSSSGRRGGDGGDNRPDD